MVRSANTGWSFSNRLRNVTDSILSRTVTLLFTDIEGSTRRWEHLPAAMSIALARHDALLRSAIESHQGTIFKTIGDAFCAAFDNANNALLAALAAQRALAAEHWGETGPVRARMALHTGTPEHRDRDYFGPPVNRVARILSAGFGGQILVSHATAHLVGEHLPADVTLQDLGSHRLKDLLQPERLYQIVATDLASDFPPIKTLDRQPHNLPAQPTPLVGREDEVVRVRELVEREGSRLVTLTGPGGTGKTRLALQAAAELVETFADGAWFVALAPLRDPNLVVAAIAHPLGVREAGHEPLETTLIDYLRDKHLLLVLDNMEHVLPVVPAIGRILAACPNVVVMATSRAALRLYGEREAHVPPLPLPDQKRLPPLGELAENPAVELFVERAQAVRPGFELTAENAAAVAGICVRLEGLPLAIELAAARVRVLPPNRLLERLSDRLALLTGGASDREDRQRTLRGAVAWSHDLLPVAQQTLFRRLAVFAGGATLDDVEAVTDPDGELGALDGLDALVSQSLLRQEDRPNGEARFAMLETIREYAVERLAESGEAEAIRARHAARFLALTETAEPQLTGSDQAEWLDRLEADHDNLRAALSWFVNSGGPDEELRLASALWRFWDAHGHLSEGRSWLERALNESEGASPTLRAKALDGVGVIASAQGDLGDAVVSHETALALSRSVGDEAGMARSTGYLGWVACFRGEFDQAVPLLEETLGHYRSAGDKRGIAIALQALSEVALLQGDYEQAALLGTESLTLHRALGEPTGVATLVHHLGRIAYHQEEYVVAHAFFEEGLTKWRTIGDPVGVVDALLMLARSHEAVHKLEEAEMLLGEALPMARELGDKGSMALALYSMGQVAQAKEEHDRARMLFLESLSLYRQVGEQVGVGECLEALAVTLCACGQAMEGAILLGAAVAARATSGVPLVPALRTHHDNAIAHARTALGDSTFEEIFAMGAVMSPEQAIAEISVATA